MPSPETITNSDDQPVRAARRRRAPSRSRRPRRRPAAARSRRGGPTRVRRAAGRSTPDSVDARTSTAASVYERSNSVVQEREQRGQRAAGEVDRAVTGRERRHRPPVDPLPHARQRIGIASRRRWRSPSAPGAVEADRHRLRRPRPGRGARPTSIRGSPALVESGEISGTAGATCVLHRRATGGIVAAGGGPAATSSTPTRSATRPPASPGSASAARVAWLLDHSLAAERRRAGARGRRRARPRRLRPGRLEDGRARGEADRAPGPGRRQTTQTQQLAQRAERVAQWANRARDLANRPPNDLTPERLADRAAEIAQGSDRALVRGRSAASRSRRWAWARSPRVAQGSHNEPRLIVLRYDPPGARDDLVLGLVGKAITFDTGGISLKPADVHGGHEGRHGRRRGRDRGHRARSPTSACRCACSPSSRRPRTWPAAARSGPATSSPR